ncbi:MAG: outer membrane beta-barrel protein [Oligoflexia bacterium]|nr:outer membrane beta-barrel protein [Oligoflexia bacterium]
MFTHGRIKFILISSICFFALTVFTKQTHAAGDFIEDQPAQETGDSTFDPFSDYSEFDEGSEEEADLNFFRNGRFFSIGMAVGYELFTDVLGQLYKPDVTYGLSLTYFFNLKFGFQVGYVRSSHAILIVDANSAQSFTGNLAFERFSFDGKYYFNTQNVTKGLGKINPYLIAGLSTYTRTQTYSGATGFARDNALGFEAGAGVEIPFSNNKWYFGLQATYNYVSFPDRNSAIIINNQNTNVFPTGDVVNLMGLLGVNF